VCSLSEFKITIGLSELMAKQTNSLYLSLKFGLKIKVKIVAIYETTVLCDAVP